MTTAVADFERTDPADADDGASFVADAPPRLGRSGVRVVVHILGPLSDDELGRLRPLLITLAGVRSPHLPALVDAGYRTDGAARGGWYATEDHGPANLTEVRPLPASLAAVAAAARGVHALHEAGLTHEGIRPEAIRLPPPGEGPGVIDLPPLGTERLTVGRVCTIGHPPRLDPLDPRVAAGAPPSRASDLWGLGATLHRAVTGRLLHPALVNDPPVIALQRVMFETVELAEDIDPAVAAAIASCVARDPAARPPSAAALADHLDTLVDAR